MFFILSQSQSDHSSPFTVVLYLSTNMRYFHFMQLSTPQHVRGKYCTFYFTIIYLLLALFRLKVVNTLNGVFTSSGRLKLDGLCWLAHWTLCTNKNDKGVICSTLSGATHQQVGKGDEAQSEGTKHDTVNTRCVSCFLSSSAGSKVRGHIGNTAALHLEMLVLCFITMFNTLSHYRLRGAPSLSHCLQSTITDQYSLITCIRNVTSHPSVLNSLVWMHGGRAGPLIRYITWCTAQAFTTRHHLLIIIKYLLLNSKMLIKHY